MLPSEDITHGMTGAATIIPLLADIGQEDSVTTSGIPVGRKISAMMLMVTTTATSDTVTCPTITVRTWLPPGRDVICTHPHLMTAIHADYWTVISSQDAVFTVKTVRSHYSSPVTVNAIEIRLR